MQELCKIMSSRNLRSGSVWVDKLFEMMIQGFKTQGRKYQMLPNFMICCREPGAQSYRFSCRCALFLLCQIMNHFAQWADDVILFARSKESVQG